MLLEYILLAGINYNNTHYIGNFIDCPHAFQYAEQHFPDYVYTCSHQDYIYLPKDLEYKFFYPKTKD